MRARKCRIVEALALPLGHCSLPAKELMVLPYPSAAFGNDSLSHCTFQKSCVSVLDLPRMEAMAGIGKPDPFQDDNPPPNHTDLKVVDINHHIIHATVAWTLST